MRLLFLLVAGLGLVSCTPQKAELNTGIWRGTIEIQGQQLPFNFEVFKDSSRYKAYLRNGKEKLLLDEITVAGDTVTMVLHIFDAELRAKLEGKTLSGYYIKNFEKNYRLPFHAVFGDSSRFEKINNDKQPVDFSGKYSVLFIHEKDTSRSVGIFDQKGNYVEGTFLNPDGDYRYLAGNVIDGKMWLSTFDGQHTYLFSAARKDSVSLVGDYWSGKSRHETWTALKNENASLPDLESMTYLKKGFEKLEFSFPDVNGVKISPGDERFRNKVLVLQIFGTWCANCMDETKFMAPWYDQNKSRGVEILGLAYERKDDFNYASGRVKKMKEKLGVHYDFVIAGSSEKSNASESLPALNKLMAFPTTIFIGRDGKVKKIHTGFSGPGTGIYYDQFIQYFNETVNELLSEKTKSPAR